MATKKELIGSACGLAHSVQSDLNDSAVIYKLSCAVLRLCDAMEADMGEPPRPTAVYSDIASEVLATFDGSGFLLPIRAERRDMILALVRREVQDERERCANLADDLAKCECNSGYVTGEKARSTAFAIRSGE